MRSTHEYNRVLNKAEIKEKECSSKTVRVEHHVLYVRGAMDDHEEVSCDGDDGTVVAYLKIVWNSNGREGGSLSQRNCLMECPFSISILIKAWLTWDSITFTWDAVEGASSYQIEVDGGKSIESATKKAFTKTGLLPDTEHSLRVRAVSRTGFVSR